MNIFKALFAHIDSFVIRIIEIINSFTHSQAIAIILFAIILRIILLPFSIKQSKLIFLTKKIQPEIDKIKAESKDALEMNARIAEVYERHKVNRFSNLIPILIQIPIMISIFQIISKTHFIDPTSTFLGWYIANMDTTLVFPFINSSLFVLSSSTNMQSGNESLIMPLILSVIMFIFSKKWTVAFHIYMITISLFAIVQDYILRYLEEN